jgi:hypothetical protein
MDGGVSATETLLTWDVFPSRDGKGGTPDSCKFLGDPGLCKHQGSAFFLAVPRLFKTMRNHAQSPD